MTTLPLSSLLQTLADELRALAVTAEEMHHLVCHEHLSHDPDYIRAVQRIDHTTQVLDNLSNFVSAVGEETADGWSIAIGPALSTIRLSELKRRLHKAEIEEIAANDDELELFG
ncbi:hypothetical protein [Aurantimonas sp. 22II-16-19i]|uniref:hypothetical protein n=1 Tax=Aurantimonas sp. 22II-16-19i TaxID=1317114 RepID=UPI0009F7F8A6|nr:hypothetical protein [Aurantimonas sp. 22II-16-19i]ORE94836.1 hypothetical protein ATO4_14289 [Aurantimonas sp. 22II-16-19i]